MPTVFMLDVSLSMFRPVQTPDNTENQTRLTLAASAINTILDHLSVHCKLEYVSLVSFSSNYEVLVPFTRDYEAIKCKLPHLEEGDKTCFDQAFHGVNQLVISEWGSQTLMQIILITDGSCGSGPRVRNQVMSRLPLPPLYPAKIHVLPMCGPNEPSLVHAMPLYQKIVDSATNVSSDIIVTRGVIYCPDQLTANAISVISTKLCEHNYVESWCVIRCGGLESRVTLFPPPQPHVDASQPISKVIHVIGFISTQDLGTPITVSRHLIIPQAQVPNNSTSTTYDTKKDVSSEVTIVDDDMSDPSKIPNFCVLLHGALKVCDMSAIVSLGTNWYGALSAGSEGSRSRRSALVLSALHPRLHPAPWLGPLDQLGPQLDQTESFPIKASRSYSGGGSGGAAWARPHALLADVQKVLRHARKLPDKTQHLFKELNRLRRAAISLGFSELLSCVCQALERECAHLPAGTSPDVSLQLAHAAAQLKDPRAALDITYTVHPLANTSFTTTHT